MNVFIYVLIFLMLKHTMQVFSETICISKFHICFVIFS